MAVLAWSHEMNAAVVGGLLAGLVVLVGVVLTEALARARGRRDRIEARTVEIVMLLPIYLEHLRVDDVEVGSVGWDCGQRVATAVNEIETIVRHHRIRQRKAVRAAVDRISATMYAANYRRAKGNALTPTDALEIVDHHLSLAVFGERDYLDDQYNWYIDHGFQAGAPPLTNR